MAAPTGMAALKMDMMRLRAPRGKWSDSTAGATAAYAASPMPVEARSASSPTNPALRPHAAVTTDQSATPAARSQVRRQRSARRPNAGDSSVYATMNALASVPPCSFESPSPPCSGGCCRSGSTPLST